MQRCVPVRSRGFTQNVVQGLHLKRILIVRSSHLRQSVFQAPKGGLILGQFLLVPLCKIEENGRFRCPCRIGHDATLLALLEPRFGAKCCQGLLLKRILFIRSGHLRQGVFQAPKVGLFLGQFSLVLPLQNLRKRAI